MNRLTARELIDVVVDDGSWTSWDVPVADVGGDAQYADELARARSKTGLDESVLTGSGSIGGHRAAILVCEFKFLGGSIGVTAGARLADAIRRATAEGLPLVALPTSGGTRMQEGTTAFLQMVRITAAVTDHKAAGLPYLVYLRHPTTGGVFASWASLGHLTLGEPGALIGFLGPRVYEALNGSTFPPAVQTAENLHSHGLLDGVCSAGELTEIVTSFLDIASGPRLLTSDDNPDGTVAASPAWETVLASRHPERPGAREVLDLADQVLELRGTGQGEVDPTLIVALARFGDMACVVQGQDRHAPQALGPAGLRQARRAMRLASELGLPLVSLIDTPGAELSQSAEEGGMAGEIARCIADMITLDVPTVSVLLGEGTGGAALALFPADRIVGATHSWLAPLPPEGASAILHRTTERAPELAARQGIRATDLLGQGALDGVIPEYPDARMEPGPFCRRVIETIRHELGSLTTVDSDSRRCRRVNRFERLGGTWNGQELFFVPAENIELSAARA